MVGLLKRKKMTVATAESCTGGMVASTLINVPGASDVFNEGYITYSNEAKQKILGVKKKTLKKEGAVSEACAEEMAKGAAKAADAPGSDFCDRDCRSGWRHRGKAGGSGIYRMLY